MAELISPLLDRCAIWSFVPTTNNIHPLSCQARGKRRCRARGSLRSVRQFKAVAAGLRFNSHEVGCEMTESSDPQCFKHGD